MLAALDIGNSKTDLVLVSEDGQVHYWARAGAMAPNLVGADETARRARRMLPPEAALTHTWIGAAGADFPDQEQHLESCFAAQSRFGAVTVRNDIHALLACGWAGGDGIAVVAGAGMNMVGSSPAGEVRFAALGRASGDRGGGLFLGEQAVAAACRAADGRGPSTLLLDQVLEHFAAPSADELSRAFDEGRIPWHRVMELAPLVLQAARAQDPVAKGLVEDHALEVAVCIRTIAARMARQLDSTPVVLGGSILRHGRDLFEPLIRRGLGSGPIDIEFPDFPPVVGAVRSVASAAGCAVDLEHIARQLSDLEPVRVA